MLFFRQNRWECSMPRLRKQAMTKGGKVDRTSAQCCPQGESNWDRVLVLPSLDSCSCRCEMAPVVTAIGPEMDSELFSDSVVTQFRCRSYTGASAWLISSSESLPPSSIRSGMDPGYVPRQSQDELVGILNDL